MDLLEKSRNTLELPAVLALLAAEAVSEPAKAEALALVRTVELGEDDGNARARACDHTEEKVHHRARNADSGELQIARKAPEDKGVHRVVKLLQDIAHDERCG